MPYPTLLEQVAVNEAVPALRALADAVIAHRPAASGPIKATPFVWRDPKTIPTRGALDMAALARDPIGTACRAEMRRIGEALKPFGREAMEAAAGRAAWDGEQDGDERRHAIIFSAWAGLAEPSSRASITAA